LPAPRTRREDILLLFKHFVLVAEARYGKEAPAIPANATQQLMLFKWPGNVRELRNTTERYLLLGDPGLQVESRSDLVPGAQMTLPQHVEAFERALIEQALEESGGIIKHTMDLLGLPRKTLYDKMKKYHLDKEVYK